MIVGHNYVDASVARMLSDLPGFCRWENRPLPRRLRQLLAELDEQTLMSLTAQALKQIATEDAASQPTRR